MLAIRYKNGKAVHSLSSVDEDSRTAICSLCGEVKIYSRGNGTWRCGTAFVALNKKVREQNTELYRKLDREKTARYREKNTELTRERCRDWRARNPEKQAAACNTWREENPDRQRQHNEKRRAALRDAFVEDIDRNEVLHSQRSICPLCSRKISGRFHIDHIIPLSKGGLHERSNVQATHIKCNQRKHTKITLP